MRKRLLYSLAVGILLPVAAFLLFMALSSNSASPDPSSMAVPGNKERAPLGVWSDTANFPSVSLGFPGDMAATGPLRLKRAGAAYYPPNNRIYILGGRHRADGEDIGSQWIWEYNPSTNTFSQKTALLDGSNFGDRFVSNMAVAVLTDTGGPRIYAIGGTSVDSLPTNRVRVYDPVADSLTTLASDTWPASPQRVPGGYAVYNNKLYIFGGHTAKPTSQQFTDTWVFDPMGSTGNKWTQLSGANISVARSSIAGATLDGYIYAIGGDVITGATVLTVTQSAVVERLDPANPGAGWQTMAPLPYPRGDMGAWAYNTGSGYEIAGRIVAAGGNYPIPDSQAYIYNPTTNSWAYFPNMLRARRNFATAQHNGVLYSFGGYNYTISYAMGIFDGSNNSMKYDASGPPPPPGITPTVTPIPSPTACLADVNYTFTTTAGATIVAGTTLVQGSNCGRECLADLALPFPFTFYGTTYNAALVSSSGLLQFGSAATTWMNNCLPDSLLTYTMLPYWDNLFPGTSGQGVYTSVTGVAPNRIFNIEWRTGYYSGGGTANFEIRLYEGTNDFEYIYGTITQSSSVASIGVQRDMAYYTEASCNVAGIVAGTKLSFTQDACGPIPTPTITSVATNTSVPTNTSIPTNTLVATSTAAATNTAVATGTSAPTNTSPPANTPTRTNTAVSTAPPTVTSVPPSATGTSVPATSTSAPTDTAVIPSATPTACTIVFADVPPDHTFYPYIMCLACRGSEFIVGYPCGGPGEPCNSNNDPYYRPGASVTRGQISKIVSSAAGFTEPAGKQQFEDILPGSTFYDYIWRLADRGILSGYACGGPGEPCGPNSVPYFRPNANATRGQISKVIVGAADMPINTTGGPHFSDVASDSTFYDWIETLFNAGAIQGYDDGTFRPSNPTTRGQISKFVVNVFYPECVTRKK